MYIKITKTKGSIVFDREKWKEVRKELQDAAEFFAIQMLGSRLAKNIAIRLHLEAGKTLDYSGWSLWEDDRFRPREFTIRLNVSLIPDWETLIETLAHEFIHVRQFARGYLKQYWRANPGVMHWHGKPYNIYRLQYWELPWEIEAYSLDFIFAEEYLERSEFEL
jgi:hypothetical protein